MLSLVQYILLKDKLSHCRILVKNRVSMKGVNEMKHNKEANLKSIVVAAVCIIMAAAGGLRMLHMVAQLNGWQAAGYALVGGIFIALFAVILDKIISFFSGD